MPPDPKVQRHLDHAVHNETFLDLLIRDVLPGHPEFADWAMVVVFYAALHYTKAALLRDHGAFAEAHRSRRDQFGKVHPGHNGLVREHFDLDAVKAYMELYDRSTEARYREYFRKPQAAVNQVQLQRALLEIVKTSCGY